MPADPAAQQNPFPGTTQRTSRLTASFAALTSAHFRIYVVSLFLGSMGFWIQRIAQDWLVLQLTGSASAVGVAVALQFAPVLVLGLYGGVLVDRFDPRRLLATTQVIAALMAVAQGVMVLTGTASLASCYALALGIGLCSVVEQPARLQLVSRLVGMGRLRSALGLNSTAFQAAGLAGPLLAGVIIHTVGLGWCFVINVATCSVVVAACALMRTQPSPAPTVTSDQKPSQVALLKEGLGHVFRTSEIAWSIALVAVMGVFGSNMAVLLTAFSTLEFGTGVSGYGVFNALVAVGCITGALIGASRSSTMRLRRLTLVITALGALFIVTSLAPNPIVFTALLVAVGLLTMTFLLSANSLVQMAAPDAVRGRVMSIYVLVLLGGQTIGGLLVGNIVDHFGARVGMMMNGLAVIIFGSLCAVGMAYQSHLTLAIRRHRFAPMVHIVSSHR